jgi:uncharacterized membrane protein YecN with MAPEG domain
MFSQTQKPVWWKVMVGLLLIFVEIDSRIHPAPNLLKADNPGEQIGMDATMVAIVAVGCWLVYSGARPLWRKTQ